MRKVKILRYPNHKKSRLETELERCLEGAWGLKGAVQVQDGTFYATLIKEQ
jgi:hypothetical protein